MRIVFALSTLLAAAATTAQPAFQLVDPVLTVDGRRVETVGAPLAQNDFGLLSLTVPGMGTYRVASEPFPGARGSGQFEGSGLFFAVNGRSVRLRSARPILDTASPRTAYVRLDAEPSAMRRRQGLARLAVVDSPADRGRRSRAPQTAWTTTPAGPPSGAPALHSDGLRADVARLRAEVARLADDRRRLAAQRNRLRSRPAGARADESVTIRQLAAERDRLTTERDQLAAARDRAETERARLAARLAALSERDRPAVSDPDLVARLRAEIAARDEALAALRAEDGDREGRLTRTEAALADARRQLTAAEAARDEAALSRDAALASLDRLASERDDALQETARLVAERDRLLQERDQLAAELAAERAESAALRARLGAAPGAPPTFGEAPADPAPRDGSSASLPGFDFSRLQNPDVVRQRLRETEYPRWAADGRIEGDVLVLFQTDRTGRVIRTAVATPLGGGLDGLAEQIVREMRFVPPLVDGLATGLRSQVLVRFEL